MLREPRAAIFDLDDTIYPYRRFVLSGFAAVASRLACTHGLDRQRTFRCLVGASRAGHHGTELQACLIENDLDLVVLPSLVAALRDHTPALRLPRQVARVLCELRSAGWRVGVLTNGCPSVQARKVAALGLASWVDAIVYATEHGPGKPDGRGFAEVLRRLDVTPAAAVFVGDDEACDIRGALAAGLGAVKCTRWRLSRIPTRACATFDRWAELPALVERALLRPSTEESTDRHAA